MINMKPGTLVRSCAIRASSRKGVIYLTPVISNPELEDWPEWKPNEVGIVLPPFPDQLGLLVMIPDGIGLCFHDEVREIQ